ncbi:hypothetical protein OA970_02965 [Alphaproteobacteria bacterium]|nr:hypothetical protein [Alphaproteobacteria bacterium]
MLKLNDQFNSVSFLDKVQIGRLNFYPIKFNLKEIPKNLKSLDELFDLDLIKVSELSDEGVVSRVEVQNDSEFNLLILDGEAIKGAKQNRIAEKSVIIPPFSAEIIPVNCVEKSRWNYNESADFSKSDFVLSPKIRETKASLMKNKEEDSIQSNVWDGIDNLSEKLDSRSYTNDLGEILEKSRFNADFDYFDKLSHKDFNGYIVQGAGRSFIEVFFCNETCKSNVKKSLNGWLADSDEGLNEDLTIKQPLYKFLESQWEKENSIGIEKNYSSDEKHNGRSVFFENKLIHAYYYI